MWKHAAWCVYAKLQSKCLVLAKCKCLVLAMFWYSGLYKQPVSSYPLEFLRYPDFEILSVPCVTFLVSSPFRCSYRPETLHTFPYISLTSSHNILESFLENFLNYTDLSKPKWCHFWSKINKCLKITKNRDLTRGWQGGGRHIFPVLDRNKVCGKRCHANS